MWARNIGVGCLTGVSGFFSGAMIGVLVGKVVTAVTRCPVVEDLPACNWQVFAGWGGVIGFVTLPALVFWRLHRGAR
ncbi:MAG TPA: hypothetical protein VNW46_10520 [Gemmatimonadaceae bacterium]|jgi:hypothetical protein|nr:hypothetical protein [Gemmatimonadaceae bacterium]